MSEWLKEHAWKACVGETLPRVRIPLSPPIKLFYGLDFLFSGPAVSKMSPKLRGVRGELLISWVFSSDVAILLGLQGARPRGAFPASADDGRPTGRPLRRAVDRRIVRQTTIADSQSFPEAVPQ